jgi:hypothetical protein
MTSWQPEIGYEVRILMGRGSGAIGTVMDITDKNGVRYRVRYRAPWGMTSGWYTREQIERVK